MNERKVTVDGLERYVGRMTVCLACSFCDNVFADGCLSDEELRQKARTAGWSGEMTRTSVDACPSCNSQLKEIAET